MKQDLSFFLPYLLNRAAELASQDFQPNYRNRFGMLRTEWRVLFHLGCRGNMTAKAISSQAAIHKTKVSRAVVALEGKRFLVRETVETDRRSEMLHLTKKGSEAFAELAQNASDYEIMLGSKLGAEDLKTLKQLLTKFIGIQKPI